MFAKPIASGLMLTAIVVLGGGALLQQDSAGEARTAVVTDAPEAEDAPEATAERAASAPGRVVDSAGFPVVPEGEREVAAKPEPTVTVNGRPINGERQPVAAQPAPEAVAEAEAGDESAEADVQAREEANAVAAIAEPPLPRPRPAGLTGPRQPEAIDYDAIAAIAYGEDRVVAEGDEFMSLEQRQRLAPIAEEEPLSRFDPRREGLVAVVGPDGEPIWIYEEQMRDNAATNSGVTFETRRVQSNPFGFVYDEFW